MGDLVGGIAQIAGGFMSANAAHKAAQQQADAIRSGLGFQQSVYGATGANLQPYIGAGGNALASLAQLYGLPAPAGSNLPAGNALNAYQAYTQTPFYSFPLQQGTQALDQSAASRGLALSGGQANALQKYGQNYASSNFGSYINALAGLANLGQNSAVTLGAQGNQAAGTVLGGQTNLGGALAAGTIGAQNGINNALSALGPTLFGPQPSQLTGSSYNGGPGGSGGSHGLGGLVGAGVGLLNAL